MEQIISEYRRLIRLLDQESDHIGQCLQDDWLKKYREILQIEKEKIEKMLRTLY